MTTRSSVSLIVEEWAWRESSVELARLRAAARLTLMRGRNLNNPFSDPTRLRNPYLHPSPTRGEGATRVAQAGFGRGTEFPSPLVGEGCKAMSIKPESAGEGSVSSFQLTILLANDERLRDLNARFRGRDEPTNVLSFPAGRGSAYLGDVAIAFGVASREAASSGIPLFVHTLHLTVHGVLHLLGYDHVKAREARTMERLETAILNELGVPSPYSRTGAAG
jgi:probable rRNA maturation factor